MSSSKKVQRSHREMYKAKTPPWKETYRKRCLDRLRESREKLKARFRKIGDDAEKDEFIQDLMRDEWKTLRDEHVTQEMDIEKGGNWEEFDIDFDLGLFEDIQAELLQEEHRLLEEYDKIERLEEDSLCSAIDKLSTEEVICPLCKKNPLLVNKSVIFCKCGLRIDTEQDCLTLTNVRQQLVEGLNQHEQGCELEPSFSLTNTAGSTNLVMTCRECDWLSIVI